MKLFKYIVVLTINIIILSSDLVFANNLHFEKISQSQKFGNKIMQQVNLSFYSNSPWKLYAQVLDLNIQNQTYPNYYIPLSRFEISNLGQIPFNNFENSKQVEIKNSDNTSNGVNNLNFNFAINTQDIDRPGFYTCDIKFTLVDNNQNMALSKPSIPERRANKRLDAWLERQSGDLDLPQQTTNPDTSPLMTMPAPEPQSATDDNAMSGAPSIESASQNAPLMTMPTPEPLPADVAASVLSPLTSQP